MINFNFVKNLVSRHKRLSIFLTSFLLLFFFLYSFLIQPVLFLYAESKTISLSLRPIKRAFNRRDSQTLGFELKYFRSHVVEIKKAVDKMAVFSILPFVGAYTRDAQNATAAVLEAYDTTLKMTSSLSPLLPDVNFEVWGGESKLKAPDLNTAELAKNLPAISEELSKYKKSFELISQKILNIDERRYPENFRGRPIRKYLRELRGVSAIVSQYIDQIVESLAVAPDLLGAGGVKNYLVLVQNDKEIRPGGGLLGGYAFLRMENGNFKLARSGDISFLDKKVNKPRPAAPEFINRLLGVYSLYLKDTNYSPDFKISATNLQNLYQETPEAFPIEGVMVVDTQLLKGLLETLGEVKVSGDQVVNAGNVETTLDGFFSYVGNQSSESRKYKDLTSVLLNEILKKSFAVSSYSSNDLLQKVIALGKAKHLLVFSHNPKLQDLAEQFGITGTIKNFEGDYLHVNDAIYSPRRSNWNINQTLTKVVKINGDNLENELKIEFEARPEPSSPADVGNLHYVRIYVPKGSKLTASDGALEKVAASEDLEKTVFAVVIKLEANVKKVLTLNYNSPKPKFDAGQYKLLIQKQPGTGDFKYSVKINDQSQEFKLSQDKEIQFKL